jgi:predicted aconitase
VTVTVTMARLRAARDALTTDASGPLRAVSLGTPHYSHAEIATLVGLLDGRRVSVDCYVSTGRDVLAGVERTGLAEALRDAGVQIVVDTCTYITPILRRVDGVVMTDSGKWAYYAPSNLGVEVAFGSVAECVESAIAGRLVRDPGLWADG